MEEIEKHLDLLKNKPISVIVRTNDEDNAWKIIENSVKAGIEFIEITLTVPNVDNLIQKASQAFPNIAIGAGTVLTLKEAKRVVSMGAKYLVSPVYNKEILKWSLKKDILYVPGVLTPNEMCKAYKNGARLLKLYPATMINPEVLSLIASPFPDFKILATGGINLKNIDSYFKAGVLAVGITDKLGGADINSTSEEVNKLAKEYMSKVLDITKERR